ncbi:putative Tail specific protease domain-containing protein [Seiridium cardinale]
MTTFLLFSFFLLLAGFVEPTPFPHYLPRQETTATTSAPVANPTICGDIIDSVNEGQIFFFASDAFDCLTSVPINQAVALRFIDYYNMTIQFQSTLAYLKDPPVGYQQPAVNVVGALEQIRNNVTAGVYKNQYTFEADLVKLVYSFHDAHVSLYAGIMASFSFASIYDLVTAADGSGTPKIYIYDDVSYRQQTGMDISPVTQINGVDTIEYLTRFAALNSVGMLEPHADWNQLMYSPVQTVIGSLTSFSGGATFYEGPWLNFTFANGTTLTTPWVAVYTNTDFTGPLTTGGDYFNYFVLGLTPPSIFEVPLPPMWNSSFSAGSPAQVSRDFSRGWVNITAGEYPAADVTQIDLEGTGYVTGYFLDDISTAVLSLPTFDESGFAVGNFSSTVDDSLSQAQGRGMKRLIVDLQGNSGGTPLLAFTTFRSIFPGVEPFSGSRRRSHALADVLGDTKTNFWSSLLSTEDDDKELKQFLASDEWVIVDRLNAATGRNFTSWSEYFGPLEENGDLFSLTERYDLANVLFDEAAFDGWFPAEYIPGDEPAGPGPWKAEDVVILTDGMCSSTCSLFVEMMTHQAGARTVVVGGRPQTGPMQAVSGSRGARAYDAFLLDQDFQDAITYDEAKEAQLPSREDTGMFITQAGFNLRDQVRSADNPAGPPLQFEYLAADCRLYYTLDNVLNMTNLWHDVANAIWNDNSRCVPDSTGYTATSADGPAIVSKPPPQNTAVTPDIPAVGSFMDSDSADRLSDPAPLVDKQTLPSRRAPVVPCDPFDPVQCIRGVSTCQPITVGCADGTKSAVIDACVRACNVGHTGCGSDAPYCSPSLFIETPQTDSLLAPTKSGLTGRVVQRGYWWELLS